MHSSGQQGLSSSKTFPAGRIKLLIYLLEVYAIHGLTSHLCQLLARLGGICSEQRTSLKVQPERLRAAKLCPTEGIMDLDM